MNLADAMLIWMPANAELYGDNPRQGQVRVVVRGANDDNGFPMSAGSCDNDWNEAGTHGARMGLLQDIVSVMIHENGITKEALLTALQAVDDINPLQLDFDRPPTHHQDD